MTLNQTSSKPDATVEERAGEDRRGQPSPAISRYMFVGKRREVRRAEDGTYNYYVDRPRPEAWWAVLLLVALSVTDAILSLRLFADGTGRELNPLLLLTLGYGDAMFITLKLALTLTGVFVLLIHWHWIVRRPWMNVRLVAHLLIAVYAVVVLWELVLLSL